MNKHPVHQVFFSLPGTRRSLLPNAFTKRVKPAKDRNGSLLHSKEK